MKDAGKHVYFHSDGRTIEILPDLVQAGVNIFWIDPTVNELAPDQPWENIIAVLEGFFEYGDYPLRIAWDTRNRKYRLLSQPATSPGSRPQAQ